MYRDLCKEKSQYKMLKDLNCVLVYNFNICMNAEIFLHTVGKLIAHSIFKKRKIALSVEKEAKLLPVHTRVKRKGNFLQNSYL